MLNAERIKLSTTRSPLWSAAAVAALSLTLAAIQASPPTVRRRCAGEGSDRRGGVRRAGADGPGGDDGDRRIPQRNDPHDVHGHTEPDVGSGRESHCRDALFSAIYAAVMVVALGLWPGLTTRCAGLSLDRRLAPGRRRRAVRGAGRDARRRRRRTGASLGRRGRAAAAVAVGRRAGAGNLPDIGSEVGPYLPFANVFIFIEVQWLYPVYAMPWGPIGSLVYFAVMVAAVFAAAIVVLNMRDA